MANYTFDDSCLKDKSYNVVARVQGDVLVDAHYNTVGRIDGDSIQDAHYNKVAQFDGTDITDAHYNKIGTIDDVRRDIEGPGGRTLVALWVLFVR